MTKGDIIVSLDIGTSKIRAIIGEYNGSTLSIIGVGSADGEGIRKGSIVDIDKTVQSIREAVEHAERMVGIQIESAFIGITGNHIILQPSHGVVAVSSPDREIGDEDIERVLQAAKVIAVPPEREIIGIVPKQYIVDGLDEINDPRGMIGVRLEVEGSIVTGSRTIISNLLRCVERAGIQNAGLVLMPLAASSIALSSDEKKLGVVSIDIGAGQTTVSVFENGVLSALSVLPIGGDHVTNDIAIGLRTQTEVAESVKLRYGYAMVAGSSHEVTFKVPRIGSNVDKEFSQSDLANIIEPRMQEIFLMVRREVERMGYVKEIPSGYVLSGGVACMPAVDRLAEFELNAPVRIAVPEYLGVRDASFVNGVGIIQYAIRNYMRRTHVKNTAPLHRKSGGFMNRVKGWFSEFV